MPAIRGLRSYPLNLIRVMPVEEAALSVLQPWPTTT